MLNSGFLFLQDLVTFESDKEKKRIAAAKAKTQSAYSGGGDDDEEIAKKYCDEYFELKM